MDAQTFEAIEGQPIEYEPLKLSAVKGWVKTRIWQNRKSKTPPPTGTHSIALVDGSHRDWSWTARRDNLEEPIREILSCLQVPGEFCWFSTAMYKFNRFVNHLDLRGEDEEGGVDVYSDLRYAVACETFGVAWAYFASTKSTVGIAWSANEDFDLMRDFVQGLRRHRAILGHPLVLGMVTATLMLKVNRRWAINHRRELYRAQIDSGYHAYEEAREDASRPAEDPGGLSVKVSGIASHICITELCSLGLQGLASFLIEENDMLMTSSRLSISNTSNEYVKAQLIYAKRSATSTLEDMRSSQKKASIVMQGLFNLIAKRDQEVSIQIAKDSMEIAEAAKKDSTSMKAIAGVTMIFLPGTFLSSFFATPLFEWNEDKRRLVTHQMWLYWAVTIPLTLVTLLAYILWARPFRSFSMRDVIIGRPRRTDAESRPHGRQKEPDPGKS